MSKKLINRIKRNKTASMCLTISIFIMFIYLSPVILRNINVSLIRDDNNKDQMDMRTGFAGNNANYGILTLPRSSAPEPSAIISAPANNSYVTGLNGPVPINVDILNPGDAATLTQNPQIYVEGVWEEMIQTSSPVTEMKNFTYWLDISSNSSGPAQYIVNVTNSNSISTILLLDITIDNDRPSINHYNNQLANGVFITDDKVVSVNVTDVGSGLDSVKMTISKKFGDFQTYLPIDLVNDAGTDNWEYLWNVKSNSWEEGVYELLFEAIDISGASSNSSIVVTVDYTNPSLSLLSPLNNSLISGAKNLTFNIYDPTTSLIGVSINISGSVQELAYSGNAHLYIHELDTTSYSDGPITVIVNTTNDAGLTNSSSLKFNIDNTKPTGDLTFNPILNGTQQIQLTCFDTNGYSKIAWRLDNKLYNYLPTTGSQNFTFESTKYTDGIHNLTLIVEDPADTPNMITKTYVVIIDNTAPEVSVKNLENNKLIPSNFKVLIQIFDATNCTLYCSVDNGEQILVNQTIINGEAIWELPISKLKLKNGYHVIVFKGIDQAGNFDEDRYKFVQTDAANPWFWVIVGGGGGLGAAAVLGTVYWVKNKNKI